MMQLCYRYGRTGERRWISEMGDDLVHYRDTVSRDNDCELQVNFGFLPETHWLLKIHVCERRGVLVRLKIVRRKLFAIVNGYRHGDTPTLSYVKHAHDYLPFIKLHQSFSVAPLSAIADLCSIDQGLHLCMRHIQGLQTLFRIFDY